MSFQHSMVMKRETNTETQRQLGSGVAAVGVGMSRLGAFAHKSTRDLARGRNTLLRSWLTGWAWLPAL